ncbi:TetR family transcriptional regulator [uncultured Jatrophihabitans sp.]|uniref:TetR family transcriptional regulator n=1 Tax=uncultured Jatrophihabitans sp. TaxID=1610747 RepID=UPI0035CAC0AC
MSRWEPDAAGRLTKAATALFAEQGYDETTVAQIAEAAGLTKRTFFRYFADKREVLFDGSHEFRGRWLRGIDAAPASAAPMEAVAGAFDEVARLFEDRHSFARVRAQIISGHPELQERELIKLQLLSADVAAALAARGLSPNAATLAAQTAVTVFHVAFARWVSQDDPVALRRLIDESLSELRSVTTA